MLRGESIQLRLIRETDLDALFTCLADIRNRGDYFPINLHSEMWLRKQYQENGFWSDDKGLLLIINQAAAVIGYIEFFKPVAYLDGYELSYLIYDTSERRKGATSEAVKLLARYLFDTRKINRLQLIIHPENVASRRVAKKSGFIHEGLMRGAWYHRGRYHDVEVYALLRRDYDAHHGTEDIRLAET